ncbi:HesB/YadR/YfhF family protein [Cerasibacillus sp. JNUCC 74]|jgi:uncharacterized protein YneR|uniref:HesB/YadR/YfhF family protein n=1 Tax=Virgibacillus proomii TaxID=84407 RepID=UPI000985395E|nr:HesB/YadR/YfhF family protein [Virgibacillus proomii]
MNIQISKEAAKWYRDELDIEENEAYVRFFVRYGGFGGNVPGFSLGVSNEKPVEVYASNDVDNITFFIEAKDAWYFEDHDLKISFSRKKQEPNIQYIKRA